MARPVDDLYTQIFHQTIRLTNIIRSPEDGDLLSQLLGDQEVTVENVGKLLSFARKYLDNHRNGAPIRPRIEALCVEYLNANNAPIPPRAPRAGEPGFHSVLEEFES